MERYENSMAALQHVKNISPGGIQEKEFGDFTTRYPYPRMWLATQRQTLLIQVISDHVRIVPDARDLFQAFLQH